MWAAYGGVWSNGECNRKRPWCDGDRAGRCLNLAVCTRYIDLDSECTLSIVGVGLGVRVSSAACNVRRSVTEAPAERVGRGVTRCLSSEAHDGPYCSCGWGR